MGRHIDVEDAPRRVFHEHKDVKEAKGRRDYHTEVARDDRLGMIAHKCHPALR